MGNSGSKTEYFDMTFIMIIMTVYDFPLQVKQVRIGTYYFQLSFNVDIDNSANWNLVAFVFNLRLHIIVPDITRIICK